VDTYGSAATPSAAESLSGIFPRGCEDAPAKDVRDCALVAVDVVRLPQSGRQGVTRGAQLERCYYGVCFRTRETCLAVWIVENARSLLPVQGVSWKVPKGFFHGFSNVAPLQPRQARQLSMEG
jgi:hypothetical protein